MTEHPAVRDDDDNNNDDNNGEDVVILENDITRLEAQLAAAKRRLSHAKNREAPTITSPALPDSSHHYLLLLSDSALPLGSFAFSSGLESYLAHARLTPSSKPSFTTFLPLSLSSYASTTLPFTLAAHRDPAALETLDDTLDASVICTVGRRASTAQGRALLSIWEKSIAPSTGIRAPALEAFAAALRRRTGGVVADPPPPVSAHLAPLFGAIASLLGLSLAQTANVFLLSHAKALVSAAVRAGLFGPYQAQRILAGAELQALIADLVRREWDVSVEEAGQSVPVMDLWIGRHEMLYSRIFNS